MAYNDFQRKNHIREIQGYLYSISFFNNKIPIVIPDGIFGTQTINAVKAFQEEYDLNVTGEVNRPTWDKIVYVYKEYTNNPVISIEPFPQGNFEFTQGFNGYEIYILQVMLDALSQKYQNISKPDINGVYDMKTISSVKSFQKITKIAPTGIFNRATANILTKNFNKIQNSKFNNSKVK